MAIPPIVLLLGAGLVAAAAAAPSSRIKKPVVLKSKVKRGGAFRAGFQMQNPLVELFGVPTDEEYPAPYRFEDAWELAHIVINAGKETAPKFEPAYKELRGRLGDIHRAEIPNWRKTYALIYTVVIPAFASPILWHWYRPVSRVKQDRFNALITWAALFAAMPQTATAPRNIEPGKAYSSLLPGMGAYLDPNTKLRRGDLDEREMRRCLYDIFGYMRHWGWNHKQYGWGESLEDLMVHAGQRMADLNAVYPLTDPPKFVIEGNLKAVDEIVWLANARVQGAINVDFDEAAAIASIVVNVVAAIVSAVVPMVGGAIGAAIQTAANALTALATMVADGEVSAAQMQAMAGAGVALVLDQAGIRLDLDEEINQLHRQAMGG